MTIRTSFIVTTAFALLAIGVGRADTSFTYQGRLAEGGQPANGVFQLEFSLWDEEFSGSQIGPPVVIPGVLVTDGLFTVMLDFGAGAFADSSRWLEIVVDGTTLAPRQPVSRTPYAIQTRGLNVDLDERVGLGIGAPRSRLDVFGEPGSFVGHLALVDPRYSATDERSNAYLTGYANEYGASADGRLKFLGNAGSSDHDLYVVNQLAGRIRLGTDGRREDVVVSDEGHLGVNAPQPKSRIQVGTLLAIDESPTPNGARATFGSNLYAHDGMTRQVNSNLPGVAFTCNAETNIGEEFRFERIEAAGALHRKVGVIGTTTSYFMSDFVGIGTTSPQARLHVNGTTRTRVLEVYGGADIAEPFRVSAQPSVAEAPAARAEPGMVVCIDPARPGDLRVSSSAYDPTVAGVISGAGGVSAGLVLRQEGTAADGTHPVALTGRVYCFVDADAGGPVRPGDLLTTSDTPGHAMRVVDRDRAAGAVIGKAMTSLDSGTGLVLVLIGLQ